MRRVVRKIAKLTQQTDRFVAINRRRQRRKIAILGFHGFIPKKAEMLNWCQAPIESFKQQMEIIAENYKVLPLREVIQRSINKQPLPDFTACLTFDDAFRSVLTLAEPILKKYQFHSTIFAASGIVGTNKPAWADSLFCAFEKTQNAFIEYAGKRYQLTSPQSRSNIYYQIDRSLKLLENGEREKAVASLNAALGVPEIDLNHPFMPLSWLELSLLKSSELFDIESHTHTHPILSRCSEDRQFQELHNSKTILSERFGNLQMLAYPNGRKCDFTKQTIKIAKDAGYNCAFSTIEGLWNGESDIFSIPRINIGAQTRLETFKMLLVGL